MKQADVFQFSLGPNAGIGTLVSFTKAEFEWQMCNIMAPRGLTPEHSPVTRACFRPPVPDQMSSQWPITAQPLWMTPTAP